ncbi:cilia- and flagella-associated protein 251 [Trichechus manatus latirostris]|uniref:Cilia- and flagella-associated protein 251 n=1 Tax=Trichechus manatus latirostris TaxID=127582 RepID=A0A2Y9RIN2_TRIMA|nr:cilia- and flagella-associated protein 251 [Trichechus manatus latirostris]
MSDAEKSPLEETEDGETEMEDEEEYNPDYQKLEDEEGEEDTLAWKESQETEAAIAKEMEEQAGEGQEEEIAGEQEEIAVPQEITQAMMSFEQLTFPGSRSIESGASPKKQSGGGSEHLLEPEGSEVVELSPSEIPNLDQNGSEEQQPSDELVEKTDQTPEREVGPEKGGWRKGKRVSCYLNPEGKAAAPKESLVSTSTEDALFRKDDSARVFPLTMTWAFGWNSSLPVFSIRDENQRVLLYVCAHTVVIYDVFRNSQHHLQVSRASLLKAPEIVFTLHGAFCFVFQGLTFLCSCACGYSEIWPKMRKEEDVDVAYSTICIDHILSIHSSVDGHFGCSHLLAVVNRAALGSQFYFSKCSSLLVLFCSIPVHTIFDSCPEGNGIRAIAITHDAKYLATISDGKDQKICIWKWTLAVETPACTLDLNKEYGFQNYLIFNPTNNKELVSNSKTRAIYYSWYEEKNTLAHSAPLLTEKTFNKLVGKFSQSVFHLNLTQILSATMEGKLVVWDIRRPPPSAITFLGFPYIKPCKLVHLQKEGITVLTTIDRNFVIATSDATVYHLTADGTKLEKLFVEPKDAICTVACHPYQPLLAIGSLCGMIKVWDYESKTYLFSRVFEKGIGVQSLTYNPEGAILGVGFTEGTVYILDAMSLENEIAEPFKYSRSGVTHISFSHDSHYMATALRQQTKNHKIFVQICGIKVFSSFLSCRKTLLGPTYGSPIEQIQLLPVKTTSELQKRYLVFINRDKVGLQILPVDGNPHKTSAIICHPNGVAGMTLSYDGCYAFTAGGHDRSVVQWEINLRYVRGTESWPRKTGVKCHSATGGRCGTPKRARPCARPACTQGEAWARPGGCREAAPQLDIGLHGLRTESSSGVKTGPCWGQQASFSSQCGDTGTVTQERVWGDGDLEKDISLLVQGILESSVSMGCAFPTDWETGSHSERSARSFFPGSSPDLSVPGAGEINDMFNEIKFGEYVDTGKIVDKINLPDFLKVYINHRPPFGNTMTGIQHSFKVLGYTNSEGKTVIQREDFLRLLLTKGEHMTQEEMLDCLATLFGMNPEGWKSEPATTSVKGSEICLEEALPDEITAEVFTTEILGLTISEDSGQDHMVSDV